MKPTYTQLVNKVLALAHDADKTWGLAERLHMDGDHLEADRLREEARGLDVELRAARAHLTSAKR